MKREILKALREAGGNFISGQSLCEKTKVTRQAVWKNISQLKQMGYDIESVPNKGYMLAGFPDILYSEDIESRMKEDSICKRVESHDIIDSTNIRAKQLAEQGEQEGTLVIAERQSAGRGRRGRSWYSDVGTGVFMSLILRPDILPVDVSGITLIAALATAKAIKEVCGVIVQIKWPNDIVLNGKKICGILTEMSAEMNCINYVVVGIGINVNNKSFDGSISDTASSIYIQTGKSSDRAQLAAVTIDRFGEYYQEFSATLSLKSFIEEYNSLLISRDKEVKILYGMKEDADESRTETGIAKGIDETGALIVDTKEGIKKIVSGEVSVRGLYGYV